MESIKFSYFVFLLFVLKWMGGNNQVKQYKLQGSRNMSKDDSLNT